MSYSDELLSLGSKLAAEDDPDLTSAIERELQRQQHTLSLVASSSIVDPSVLACMASAAVNVTAEGYPGRRYHAGTEGVDTIESLAIERACSLFRASYANVQPHSASTANYAVLTSLLEPGDVLLGMDLSSGGHLTHGSPVALSGRYYRAVGYGLTPSGSIDLDQVRHLARKHRPKVIIAGATAYSRAIDFAAFRAIANDVDAVLMADISHVAGLVVAGLHDSSIDSAHITTTCTHKQLYGPRGGLILSGAAADEPLPRSRKTVRQVMQRAVFPFTQGAPAMNIIAAKARALALAGTQEFRHTAERIVGTAQVISRRLAHRGYRVVSGGTENHIILLDLGRRLSGLVAERALQDCRIIVNKNHVPQDHRPSTVTSGMRLGTNGIARRDLTDREAERCADLVAEVLSAVKPHGDHDYELDPATTSAVRGEVAELTESRPLPGYPLGVFSY